VVTVRSKREIIGQESSQETRCFLSSLTDVEKAARAIRSHWGIENKLHWTLDVLMNEDDWMTKIAAIAANIAAIRKLAPDFPRKAKQEEGKTVVAYADVPMQFESSLAGTSAVWSVTGLGTFMNMP
jgi:predicted transposase YbfD/YdcC